MHRKQPGISADWRLGALLLPQTAVSAVAVTEFVHESGFSDQPWMRLIVGTHLDGVILAQTLFFAAWSWVARTSLARSRPAPARVFALTSLGALLALNLCYAAQALSLHIWSSPLTPSIRATLWPQLRYFVANDTSGALALLAGLGLGLTAAVVAVWRQSGRCWRILLWAAPPHSRGAARLALIFGLAATATLWAGRTRRGDGDLIKALRNDPVASPWIGFDARPAPPPGGLSADNRARRDYPLSAPFRRRNVVVIIVDCLRADHLPFFGYPRPTAPFLQELMTAGRLQPVTEAYAVSNASKNGILGVLASRYPERLQIGNFMLQDVLKLRGYRTHIIASGDHTVYQSLRAFYGEHVDFYVDGLSAGFFTVNDDRNVLATLGRLPASDGTPAFFYLHLMSAHPVGVRQPEALRWPSEGGAKWTVPFGAGFLFRQAAIDTYDNGIFQSDLYLRRIFALLAAKGYLRDYVAVITGDHGQSFGEHGVSGHGRSLWQSEVRIPVLFLESGNFRYGPMPFASQVDIAPTLLARLNLPPPSSWQGRSLLDGRPDDRLFLTETAPGRWRGVVEDRPGYRYKYLFATGERADFHEKLFDLSRDAAETRDLARTAAPAVLADLREAAADHFQTPLPP